MYFDIDDSKTSNRMYNEFELIFYLNNICDRFLSFAEYLSNTKIDLVYHSHDLLSVLSLSFKFCNFSSTQNMQIG